MASLSVSELGGAVNAISVTPSGLTANVEYEISGVGADGRPYFPRGYLITGGSERTVVDSVYPLTGDVTYQIIERGTDQVLDSVTITPTLTNIADPVQLVSFDGSLRIDGDLAADRADGLSVGYTMRRNVVHTVGSGLEYATWDVPIEGGPTVGFRVRSAGMAAVRNLVASGAPIYLRMRPGWAGDVPAAGLWAVAEAGYTYEGLDDESYLWEFQLVPTRDPRPRVGQVISDWTAFNDAMVRLGWNYTDLQNFLATFNSWAEAATVDWSAM